MKELNLFMNILKLRIINYDDIQNGSNILKAYFVNSNSNLRYIELNLEDEENVRYQNFAKLFIENFVNEEEDFSAVSGK
jgi:hypothetical protein